MTNKLTFNMVEEGVTVSQEYTLPEYMTAQEFWEKCENFYQALGYRKPVTITAADGTDSVFVTSV